MGLPILFLCDPDFRNVYYLLLRNSNIQRVILSSKYVPLNLVDTEKGRREKKFLL